MNNKNKSKSTPILATLFIVVGILAAYLAYDRYELIKVNQQYEETIKQSEIVQADLQVSYDDLSKKLDEMKTDNVELNALIEEQKAELSKKKDEINSTIWSKKKLKQAKSEIDQLKALGNQYLSQIEQLKSENADLSQLNLNLKREREALKQTVAKQSETTKILEQEKEVLKESKDKLTVEKSKLSKETQKLKQTVDKASIILVDNILTRGFRKRNGKLDQQKKAKRVELISSCFNTLKNLAAEQQQETFYLRVISPLGETMMIEDLGSGIIDGQNGEKIRYTNKTTVEFDGEENLVCINWAPEGGFTRGLYQVEVYNKGFLAGKSSFKLD